MLMHISATHFISLPEYSSLNRPLPNNVFSILGLCTLHSCTITHIKSISMIVCRKLRFYDRIPHHILHNAVSHKAFCPLLGELNLAMQ